MGLTIYESTVPCYVCISAQKKETPSFLETETKSVNSLLGDVAKFAVETFATVAIFRQVTEIAGFVVDRGPTLLNKALTQGKNFIGVSPFCTRALRVFNSEENSVKMKHALAITAIAFTIGFVSAKCFDSKKSPTHKNLREYS